MAECAVTLVDRQRIARNTTAFWFDADDASFEFQPGQHADFVLALPYHGANGQFPDSFTRKLSS